jgi:hypothetical protein
VRTLADSEDLVLQRVGIVTDDTDLDVDGHFTWLVCLVLNLKNDLSVLTD